ISSSFRVRRSVLSDAPEPPGICSAARWARSRIEATSDSSGIGPVSGGCFWFDSLQIGDAIEVAVVGADGTSTQAYGNGGMERIASGQARMLVHEVAADVENLSRNGNDDRDDPACQVVDPAAILPPGDRTVTVQDLLQSLSVDNRL